MSSSKSTTDHKFIREWAEDRKGSPACVKKSNFNKLVKRSTVEES